MIICISGLTGSGKTTIGEMLSKELKIAHVNRSFKEFAEEGKDLIKFQNAVKPNFDREFDREISREAHRADCVVSTWFGPWIIKDATLNVWLNASPEARARRKAKDLHCSLKGAQEYFTPKDRRNRRRMIKDYGIDILKDHGVFDVEINTDRLKREEVVALIAMLSLEKENKKFR